MVTVNTVAEPPANLDSEAESSESEDEAEQALGGQALGLEDELSSDEENAEPIDDVPEDAPPCSSSTRAPPLAARAQAAFDYRWSKREPPQFDATWLGQVPPPPADQGDKSPTEYLKDYLNDELFELFAAETNRYSVEITGNSINTTAEEMKQFVSIHVTMGSLPLPRYALYWSSAINIEKVTRKMGLKRFKSLRRYFHLVDNNKAPARDSPDFDRLFKLRPLIEYFRQMFLAQPNGELQSVDEQMIPFKGRSNLKQYIKNKPKSWGFKSYNRCGVSGFTYDFIIHGGPQCPDPHSLGSTGAIVVKLCEGLPRNQNYKVYFDNYYTSPKLVHHLQKEGILSLGTIRSNRMAGANALLSLESALKKKPRGTFEVVSSANSGLCCCVDGQQRRAFLFVVCRQQTRWRSESVGRSAARTRQRYHAGYRERVQSTHGRC